MQGGTCAGIPWYACAGNGTESTPTVAATYYEYDGTSWVCSFAQVESAPCAGGITSECCDDIAAQEFNAALMAAGCSP